MSSSDSDSSPKKSFGAYKVDKPSSHKLTTDYTSFSVDRNSKTFGTEHLLGTSLPDFDMHSMTATSEASKKKSDDPYLNLLMKRNQAAKAKREEITSGIKKPEIVQQKSGLFPFRGIFADRGDSIMGYGGKQAFGEESATFGSGASNSMFSKKDDPLSNNAVPTLNTSAGESFMSSGRRSLMNSTTTPVVNTHEEVTLAKNTLKNPPVLSGSSRLSSGMTPALAAAAARFNKVKEEEVKKKERDDMKQWYKDREEEAREAKLPKLRPSPPRAKRQKSPEPKASVKEPRVEVLPPPRVTFGSSPPPEEKPLISATKPISPSLPATSPITKEIPKIEELPEPVPEKKSLSPEARSIPKESATDVWVDMTGTEIHLSDKGSNPSPDSASSDSSSSDDKPGRTEEEKAEDKKLLLYEEFEKEEQRKKLQEMKVQQAQEIRIRMEEVRKQDEKKVRDFASGVTAEAAAISAAIRAEAAAARAESAALRAEYALSLIVPKGSTLSSESKKVLDAAAKKMAEESARLKIPMDQRAVLASLKAERDLERVRAIRADRRSEAIFSTLQEREVQMEDAQLEAEQRPSKKLKIDPTSRVRSREEISRVLSGHEAYFEVDEAEAPEPGDLLAASAVGIQAIMERAKQATRIQTAQNVEDIRAKLPEAPREKSDDEEENPLDLLQSSQALFNGGKKGMR